MSDGNPNNFKIRGHAIAIMEVMMEESYTEDNLIMWAGSITAVFRKLGINQGYHTIVMRLLKATNCVEQVVKGTRGVKSVYVINRDPRTIPEADWPSANSIVKSQPGDLTMTPASYKLLVEQVRGIESRLAGLNVGVAFSELQEQLDLITDRLSVIEQRLGLYQ